VKGNTAEFNPISDGFDDSIEMFTAPVSWEKKDWVIAGAGAGAIAASSIWDRPMFGQWGGNNNGLANFGNTYAYAGPAAAMLIYGGIGLANEDEGAYRTAWDIGEAAGLSVLLTGVLKVAVGRERPNVQGNNATAFSPGTFSDVQTSFPSGHTALAFSMAAVLEDTDLPIYVKATSFALAGVTAWARVHDDQHWVSDTVAGALIGYGVGRFVVKRNAVRAETEGYFMPSFENKGWGIVWNKRF